MHAFWWVGGFLTAFRPNINHSNLPSSPKLLLNVGVEITVSNINTNIHNVTGQYFKNICNRRRTTILTGVPGKLYGWKALEISTCMIWDLVMFDKVWIKYQDNLSYQMDSLPFNSWGDSAKVKCLIDLLIPVPRILFSSRMFLQMIDLQKILCILQSTEMCEMKSWYKPSYAS